MKKVLLFTVLSLFLTNCKSDKKSAKKSAEPEENKVEVVEYTPEEEIEEDVVKYEPTKDPKADKDLLDPKQGVIVVFNGEDTETEDLIHEKGLKLEKMLLDQNSLKVGLIKVPADKKEYWINRLIESGAFKDVKLYSEKNLNKLLKQQKGKK